MPSSATSSPVPASACCSARRMATRQPGPGSAPKIATWCGHGHGVVGHKLVDDSSTGHTAEDGEIRRALVSNAAVRARGPARHGVVLDICGHELCSGRAFGLRVDQGGFIRVLLVSHLVERLRSVTLNDGGHRRKRLIRLFLRRFLAPPPQIPRRSSTPSSERHALLRPVDRNARRSLRSRAIRRAVASAAIARSADREPGSTSLATSGIALHRVRRRASPISGPARPERGCSRCRRRACDPCAVRTDRGTGASDSGPSPLSADRILLRFRHRALLSGDPSVRRRRLSR